MGNLLRRLPLSRLALLLVLVLALGVGATAIAFALDTGPTPPPKPLAEAVHDALSAPPVQGVSARVKLTNNLLEGADIASGDGGSAGELTSSPLFTGASGRLWISADGHVRLELQAEKGDTEILYDGHTVTLYDAASNTLYRYTPPAGSDHAGGGGSDAVSQGTAGSTPDSGVPSVAKIEEAISHLQRHTVLSGATPTDVAGQPAYTVHIGPREGGSLLGGAELSWDAVHGVPLRAAVYSTKSTSPVLELAASEISYGPVEASTFELTPPAGAKVEEVSPNGGGSAHQPDGTQSHEGHAKLTTRGHGPATIAVIESPVKQGGGQSSSLPEGLQKVTINGTSAAELPTALGTLLGFERAGVRYLVLGAVDPAAVEAVAKGL